MKQGWPCTPTWWVHNDKRSRILTWVWNFLDLLINKKNMFSRVTGFKIFKWLIWMFLRHCTSQAQLLDSKDQCILRKGRRYILSTHVHITYQMGNMFTFKLVRTLDIENWGWPSNHISFMKSQSFEYQSSKPGSSSACKTAGGGQGELGETSMSTNKSGIFCWDV